MFELILIIFHWHSVYLFPHLPSIPSPPSPLFFFLFFLSLHYGYTHKSKGDFLKIIYLCSIFEPFMYFCLLFLDFNLQFKNNNRLGYEISEIIFVAFLMITYNSIGYMASITLNCSFWCLEIVCFSGRVHAVLLTVGSKCYELSPKNLCTSGNLAILLIFDLYSHLRIMPSLINLKCVFSVRFMIARVLAVIICCVIVGLCWLWLCSSTLVSCGTEWWRIWTDDPRDVRGKWPVFPAYWH